MTLLEVPFFGTDVVWSMMIQFGIIAIGLLVGNILRTKVPFLQKSLIPSALLGGAVLLIFKALPDMQEVINKSAMEVITYHTLGIGFVALALKNNGINTKAKTMTVVETGTLTASTYIIQGIVGLLVTIPLFYFGGKIFYSAGMLLPMGYGQGPGQAMNIGGIYMDEAAKQGMVFPGKDFGLSIAAIGFIVGSVISVIYMNYLKRKGEIKISEIRERQKNKLSDYEGPNEIPDSESVDKLSIQICLVLMTYSFVYFFNNWLQTLPLGEFGERTLMPLMWGFNFFLGTLFGFFVKWILNMLKKKQVIKREYSNNYLLNRISGFAFDIMIVAGTASINFSELKDYALPLVIICTIGAAVTFFYVLKVSKHLYPNYKYEGFFSMFGMLTGTASNGMILLREIDPKFETPAANNLVLQAVPAVIFGFPVLLLIGLAPLGLRQTMITLAILIVVFIAFTVFLFRKKIFKKYKTQSEKNIQ